MPTAPKPPSRRSPGNAAAHLRAADPILARLIDRVGPCTLRPRTGGSPYRALVKSVVYQQLNGTAAETIYKRVCKLYPGNKVPSPDKLSATPDERLRGAGLSRAKTLAVKDIAAKAAAGLVPSSQAARRLSDAQLVERLTQIRGVGPWTVEMFLIFTLGRPDVLPVTDYGVRKGFAIVYGWKDLPTPKELLAASEPWRPFRSTAAWYLWRALDLQDNIET